MWLSAVFAILLIITLIAWIVRWRGRNGAFGGRFGTSNTTGGYVEGVLTVTGVSTRNAVDRDGNSGCMISGTIIGPGIPPTEVYGDQVLHSSNPWPRPGDELAVIYKPQNPDRSWRIVRAHDPFAK